MSRSRWRTSRVAVFMIGLLIALLPGLSAQQPLPELLVIDHVTIFDGNGGPVLKNGVIVIEGNRIRDIGRRGTIRGGKGVTILDASGKFAIPGLIDAHVHFDQSAGIYARPDAVDLRGIRSYPEEIEWTRQRLHETLARYARSGVTGVVDMGGPMWSLDFRDSANADPLSTSVAAAGPLLSTVAEPELDSADPAVILMESPEQVQRVVHRIAERKPDLIKVLFVNLPGDDLDRQEALVQVAIAESHRLGIRVAVHATRLAAAKAALAEGADILVHSVDDRRIDSEFLAMLKARNALYIPTLLVTERYDAVFSNDVKLTEIERRLADPEVVQSWGELSRIPREKIPGGIPPAVLSAGRPTEFLNLQILSAAEMRIAAGSDAGNIGTPHGPALHREMELMMEAGMRPFDILLAATRNAAEVMGREKEVGTLAKGKIADIVLLHEDPVRDIRNTQKIFKVMKAGQWIETGLPQPAARK